MSIKTFSTNDPVTSVAFDEMSFQAPNSVLYGAMRNGLVVTATALSSTVVASLVIDALLGPRICIHSEFRHSTGATTAYFELSIRLPGGTLAYQAVSSNATTTWTDGTTVLDVRTVADGGDCYYDLRGAKVTVELALYQLAASGQAELRNVQILGGSGESASEFGF